MGKAVGLLAAMVVALCSLVPGRISTVARAQTVALPCSGGSSTVPMQGHYTGPWHSDGEYHFRTMGYDVDLKVVIDGTLDLQLGPDGHVTGTASGNVEAPVYDFGQKDVSSGSGTISGSVIGIITATGSILLISHPTILMHWGTFVPGGYTVDRSITMPDYQLTTSAAGCVSSSGSIAEKDFPTQTIIADGAGTMAQAPGIGSAGGTWQITSDKAEKFADLSREVDAFIAAATTVLASSPLRPAQIETQILAPLRTLVSTITQDPEVSRCLMDRLSAWERSAAAALYSGASAVSPADLAGYRVAGDLLRSASLLGATCQISDGGSGQHLVSTELAALTSDLATPYWDEAALVAREVILFRGPDAQRPVQTAIVTALHPRLGAVSDSTSLLALARIAYTFGDMPDSQAAFQCLTSAHTLTAHLGSPKGKKKGKRPAPKPKPTPTTAAKPKSTPTATPKPTSTAQPTLERVLAAGIARIDAHATADGSFSWQPVSGATSYVVAVYGGDGALAWSWSGSGRSVAYGETGIEGVPGTSGDGWPVPLPTPYAWSVAAVDGSGKILGLKLR